LENVELGSLFSPPLLLEGFSKLKRFAEQCIDQSLSKFGGHRSFRHLAVGGGV
jgi:hypothetical protein